jgi:hypothetical protein
MFKLMERGIKETSVKKERTAAQAKSRGKKVQRSCRESQEVAGEVTIPYGERPQGMCS